MKMTPLLLASLCAVPTLCAQQAPNTVVSLTATTKVVVPSTHYGSMSFGEDMCDSAGNLYTAQDDTSADEATMKALTAEEVGATMRKRATLPFQKITPVGTLAGSFGIADVFPGARAVTRHGFFVSAEGKVFQAVHVHDRDDSVFVVEFAQDGSVKAKTELQVGPLRGIEGVPATPGGPVGSWASPWHLAVFKSGEYLLTGAAGKDRLTPFTAVFDANGRMLKKIYEPEDEEARLKTRPDAYYASSRGGDGGLDFLRSGGIAAGPDGNVYLLHGTQAYALVYVISSKGDVVRKLRIESGDPELVARSIKLYAGHLAVEFDDKWAGERRNLIKVTDLQGGPVADYKIGTVGGDFLYMADYGPEGFTFTPWSHEGNMYLVKAKLP
jgi:hypothetical protein